MPVALRSLFNEDAATHLSAGLVPFLPMTSWLLVPVLAGSLFGLLRLSAWVLFLHLPVLTWLWGVRVRRKTSRPGTSSVARGATLMLALVGLYSTQIEPRWLEVTEVEVASSELLEELRVVVLADFQTDRIGGYERRVMSEVARQKPDLVLLLGDYLQVHDADRRDRLAGRLRHLLAGIDPRLGIWAVRGNTDREDWFQIFVDRDSGSSAVHTIDRTTLISLGDLELVALSLRDSFDAELSSSDLEIERRVRLTGDQASTPFRIVFGHGPDFALGLDGADLLLAGHTHGGQVRLPMIGPLITFSRVPRAWSAGRTELPQGGTLIVSRGTGMERGAAPRLRFSCRPELLVVRLRPGPRSKRRV